MFFVTFQASLIFGNFFMTFQRHFENPKTFLIYNFTRKKSEEKSSTAHKNLLKFPVSQFIFHSTIFEQCPERKIQYIPICFRTILLYIYNQIDFIIIIRVNNIFSLFQAYKKQASTPVQIAKLICLTVFAITFLVGFFVVSHKWMQTRECNCPKVSCLCLYI